MNGGRPHAVFLAGPNGAGKSTTARALLRDYLGVIEYVNADAIAAGLSVFRLEAAALQASSALLERIDELVQGGRSFAVETTLAAKSYVSRLAEWQLAGYRVDLHFLWLPSVELAVQRVAMRVRAGGHGIPEETIRRRYDRGLTNFRQRYRNGVDRWFEYDASQECGPIRIAFRDDSGLRIEDTPSWDSFADTHND